MTDGTDPADDDRSTGDGGVLGAIQSIVDALIEAERDDRTTFGDSGRISGPRFTTEYGYSGRIGGSRNRSDDSSDREGSDSFMIDVRESDDELLVVADVPAVDPADVRAGIDEGRDELAVGVGSGRVERIALPWPVDDVQAQLNHGVLELRFSREEEEDR